MKTQSLSALFAILALATPPLASAAEEKIALSKVPEALLAAAKAAVPGIKITEAETETTAEGVTYELEGKANGKEYEIKLNSLGIVLKVTTEDDDD